MSGSAGLPAVLADAAKALGILDEGGRLQDAFFAGPLTQMRVMLTEPRRRAALLRALDGLLSAAPPRATEPARRRYPLGRWGGGRAARCPRGSAPRTAR